MSKQTLTPNRPVRPTAARQPAGKSSTLSSRTAANRKQTAVKPFNMPFEQRNILMIIAGVAVIGLGYLLMWSSPAMSSMALTISPLILLIGYCIVVPMGIMAGSKTFKKDQPTSLGDTSGNGTAVA